MEASAGPVARGLRAGVFGAMCVALSVVAHVAAHGAVPPLWVLLAGLVAVTVVTGVCAGPAPSLLLVVGLMAATQAGLHAAFGAWPGAASGPDLSRLLCAAPGAHAAAAATLLRREGLLATVGGAAPHPALMPAMAHGGGLLLMSGAHLLVAGLTAWWLRRVDAALGVAGALVGVLARGLCRLLGPPAAPAPVATGRRQPRSAMASAGWPCPAGLRHSVVRRGPPQVC
ncbi:hypothetical protein FF36_02614 [Frankia torreyi]|uniref:Uncharacterized protein n=1 Tax=Frankia torreyi TaxID=1856 RepID=A0A0D8BGB4_9ACTN|nr:MULTISPECIES: hypothetical protein [Frankia]KJE23014.1 hypothetical protein FF36_02614 [Frankia torreyi]KQC36040.1 hypothetical protein UK82_22975 [Frankia sp. ACN1ag]KQM05177.1 hypothetical protein FF86_101816 [Frankia sp. CpI1-P]